MCIITYLIFFVKSQRFITDRKGDREREGDHSTKLPPVSQGSNLGQLYDKRGEASFQVSYPTNPAHELYF